MPIYPYFCKECGDQKEMILSVKDHDTQKPFICCYEEMKRDFSTIQFSDVFIQHLPKNFPGKKRWRGVMFLQPGLMLGQ